MSGKQFLYIIIATFLTVCAWVIFDILHSRSEVKTSPQVEQLLEPLDPKFDQETINQLNNF